MIKQCGNCKWWDRKVLTLISGGYVGKCDAPYPSSMCVNDKQLMFSDSGKHCPVFEERKE